MKSFISIKEFTKDEILEKRRDFGNFEKSQRIKGKSKSWIN